MYFWISATQSQQPHVILTNIGPILSVDEIAINLATRIDRHRHRRRGKTTTVNQYPYNITHALH